MSEQILTFNGVSSDSIGLIVDGYFSRGVAQRRFRKVPVPGYNGDYLIDLESYESLEEGYKAYWVAKETPQENEKQFQKVVQWMKQGGYYLLEDSEMPGFFWQAMAQGLKKSDVINHRDCFYEIPLIFDRLPQCFSYSGEIPVAFPREESKNLIKYPYYSSGGVRNGVEFRVNADGSVTLNGTATSTVSFNFTYSQSNPRWLLPPGQYKLSGCPVGGTASSYRLICNARVLEGGSASTTLATDFGRVEGGVPFTVSDSITYDGMGVYIQLSAGTVCNNLTFYPMIREASTDPEWEPYLVNMLYNPFEEKAEPFITLTLSGTGSLTINGVSNTFDSYSGTVTIDCSSQQVRGGTHDNLSALFHGDFPVLLPGLNTVSFSGDITDLQIKPRWWTR